MKMIVCVGEVHTAMPAKVVCSFREQCSLYKDYQKCLLEGKEYACLTFRDASDFCNCKPY